MNDFVPLNFKEEEKKEYHEKVWLDAFMAMKNKVNEAQKGGATLSPEWIQFWNSTSWPIYTTNEDRFMLDVHEKWMNQFFDEGLVRSMNVYLKRYSLSVMFGALGEGAMELMEAYTDLLKTPEQLEKERKEYEEKAGVPYKEPVFPAIKVDDQSDWIKVFDRAKELVAKYQLRGVNIPWDMSSEEAIAFMNKIDQTFGNLAEYLKAPNEIIGLGGWLSVKARSLGSLQDQNEHLSQEQREQAEAKKKEDDKFSGAYNIAFIQIQMDREFKEVVLAHEWMHALDHWYGSKEIVKSNPAATWSQPATAVAWMDAQELPAEYQSQIEKAAGKELMKWATVMKKGAREINPTAWDEVKNLMAQGFEAVTGEMEENKKKELIDVNVRGINHPYMKETRDYYQPYQVNLLKTLEEMTISRILHAFPMGDGEISKEELKLNELAWKSLEVKRFKEIPDQRKSQLKELGRSMLEDAKDWAKRYEKTVLKGSDVNKHFKNFQDEWGDLIESWVKKVSEEMGREIKKDEDLKDLKNEAKMIAMQTIIPCIFISRLKPEAGCDDHYLQALRMDIMGGGGVGGYFSKPWELLAYKFEELYMAKVSPSLDDDAVGFQIKEWLDREVVPALVSEIKVSKEKELERQEKINRVSALKAGLKR